MCAADTIHSGVLQQNCPTNLKCVSDLTAAEEPQLRAGRKSGTNVDLADFKKACKTVLFISSFCCIYAEFNTKQRGFCCPDRTSHWRLIIQWESRETENGFARRSWWLFGNKEAEREKEIHCVATDGDRNTVMTFFKKMNAWLSSNLCKASSPSPNHSPTGV